VQTMRAVAVAISQALALLITASLFIAVPAAATELPTEEASTLGPQEVMASLSSSLFASLDKESTQTRHNSDKIVPLLDGLLSRHFDMEYAARMVLGLHWRSATPEQRQQFGVVLYQRLLRTYATSVADWTPDRFKLLPLHADPEALQVTVRTLVTNSRHEIVSVDFRMRQTTEGWKIFDVTVGGVSYMRIYHDDTDEEITQKGLDASIARLSKSPIVGHEKPNSRGEP
jgi:phospholipid transport system substrate-binding protein